MQKKISFLLFVSLFLLINICVVSASDVNMTDESPVLGADEGDSVIVQDISDENQVLEADNADSVVSQDVSEDEPEILEKSSKTTPSISINNNVHTKQDSLEVTLKDNKGNKIAGENVIVNIAGKNYTIKTASNGVAKLKIGLAAKNYPVEVFYKGNDNYNSLSKTFTFTVLKTDTKVSYSSDTVLKSNYFYSYLKDSKGNPISGVGVGLTVCGKTYIVKTDANGVAKLKIGLSINTYPFKISFNGNKFYNPSSKDLRLIVPYTTSIAIGNSKLLTNGYLKIYLKSDYQTAIRNKDVVITANGVKFNQKTTSEGIISFKPFLSVGKHTISVKYAGTRYIMGSSSSKSVDCIKGDALNPLTTKVPTVNGAPNVDYLIRGYVLANENGQYTLTKSQYKEVIDRDSYCLFLNSALSKYTCFKSKDEPNYQHIIKREKWNVIERAINTKIVKANKYNYWPDSITVNLKGKQYSYSEVRDEQNTGYTCGPTSNSICSQALRNYVNEWRMAQLAGTTYEDGSSTSGLKTALESCNMKCDYFYKSSWSTALNELSKGNCALVFHTWYHYVAIIDISADGKKVLVVNPSGDYDHGSHDIPTKWLSIDYMYGRFNDYDTSSLIVKLKYSLSSSTKNTVNNFYSSMGTNWNRHNVNERVPQIGK